MVVVNIHPEQPDNVNRSQNSVPPSTKLWPETSGLEVSSGDGGIRVYL